MSEKNFNEPSELFDSLRAFFLSKYTHINLSVYRYDKTDKALNFYLGDVYSNTKKIHLSRMGNNDYINEQAALESGKFEYDIGVDGFG
jgi:hypothetical protein